MSRHNTLRTYAAPCPGHHHEWPHGGAALHRPIYPYGMPGSLHHHALAIYRAAVVAVAPGPAVARTLIQFPPPSDRVWCLAIGKASLAMAEAAVRHLELLDVPLAGGLIVAPTEGPSPHPALPLVVGDHPEPGQRSAEAAATLGQVVDGVLSHDEVWVLLSGGTSSLLAAPIDGIPLEDFIALHARLMRAGLPIDALNGIRKRFLRWGGGRLAAALRAARVRVLAISDVPGDDLASIGSGPCTPDPLPASDVLRLLEQAGLSHELPATIRKALDDASADSRLETPKPEDPCFDRVESHIVATNARALAAAADQARSLGYRVSEEPHQLSGEAAAAGAALARVLAELPPTSCHLAGGETTVRLGPDSGTGGRCQELALAAAERLAGWPKAAVLLAGGSDGRDGPTDATGAIVDTATWHRIEQSGLRAAHALAHHDAYPALQEAGALFRVGHTGTNVMDLVIGLVGPAPAIA